MKYYAIQTELSAQEVHEKLGFNKSWYEFVEQDFDENADGIYLMSHHRIENNNIDELTIDDFKIDETSNLMDHANISGAWWVNHGAVYDHKNDTWVTIDNEKTEWLIKAVLVQFAEEFTNIAKYKA